jgi:protein-disulfide isomerase
VNKQIFAPLYLAAVASITQCAKPDLADELPKPAATVAAGEPAARPVPNRDVKPPAADDVAAAAVRVPVEGLPSFGSARALVTIVAFTDYECPYCAKADERIGQLRAEYGDRVRLVVASHPLEIHDRAGSAARAFLAAVEQGKGEAMHQRLFAKQAALDEEGLRTAARDVGLDLTAFDRARKGAATEIALHQADLLATTLTVDATPTFFVNGRKIVGARPIEAFRALIDEELVKARGLVERGIAPERVYEKLVAQAPAVAKCETCAKGEAELANDQLFDVAIDKAPLRGVNEAPVTIVLFSDFQCPFCAKAEKTLRSLEAANPGKVRVAFRHRPLPFHDHAKLAAKASLAAERQGRFWEYHDLLVEHPNALSRDDLERYASDVGLDRTRFARDLDDPTLDDRITQDERQAEKLEVKGTPTAFINGRRLTGAQPLAAWQGVVDRALAAR